MHGASRNRKLLVFKIYKPGSNALVLAPNRNTQSCPDSCQSQVLRPQILEEQQELAFHLQQQRLIELIREGRVDDALEFAQENLAPLGEEQPALLEELGAPLTLAFTYRSLFRCDRSRLTLGNPRLQAIQ